MNEKFEEFNIFPYPKLIQAINYFFPRKEGSIDVFSMENIRKIARFAPYLGFFILLIMVAIFFTTCVIGVQQMNPAGQLRIRSMAYGFIDLFLGVSALVQYCRWLFFAVLAKIAKRSPDVPLVLSFVFPLKMLGGLCVFHSGIFVVVWLYNLIEW